MWAPEPKFDCSNPHPATLARSYLLPSLYSYLWSIDTAKLLSGLHSPSYGRLRAWYFDSDPLESSLTFCFWSSVACWILGELTGNFSQVDRLWTFLPVIYSAHFVALAPKADQRMKLLLACQVAWSIRLSINSYKRGIFEFKEDYRWEVLKKQISKWELKILHLTFVAFIQNILLLITSLPQYLLFTTRFNSAHQAGQSLIWADYLLVFSLAVVLALEMVADNQQQAYQRAKQADQQHKSPDAKRGFVTSGLWYYSRHPNVACEQLVWYILYGFTLTATRSGELCWSGLVNYSIASPICMSLLLYPSTVFTENISGSKYPSYVDYQKTTDMFWPPLTYLRRFLLKLRLHRNTYEQLIAKVFGNHGEFKGE